MLCKIDGADYKDYNLPPTEEGVINKTLPLEIFQEVFSYLDNKSIQQATLVNHLWKRISFDQIKQREFLTIKDFAKFLSGHLDVKLYPEQKNKLSNMGSSRFEKISLLEIKQTISKFNEEVKEVLLTISDEGLNELFDSFKDVNKPPLFYKFVFLSKKYKQFLDDLNKQIKHDAAPEPVMVLLKAGAVPTEETLKIAKSFEAAPEIVNALSEARALSLAQC